MDKIVMIVQARMGAERLPGKVLLDIAGKPLIERVLLRLWDVEGDHQIVVATTTHERDNVLVGWLEDNDVSCFRGSQTDVLQRYADCARVYDADLIVRVTGDNPFIEPRFIDAMIQGYRKRYFDYACMDACILGTGAEMICRDSLETASKNATHAYQREHVTPYIREHPDIFTLRYFPVFPFLKREGLRLTIDEEKDLKFVRQLFDRREGAECLSLEDVIEICDAYPAMMDVNRDVQQREAFVKTVS